MQIINYKFQSDIFHSEIAGKDYRYLVLGNVVNLNIFGLHCLELIRRELCR